MKKIIEEIKKLIKEANEQSDVHALIDINMRLSGFLIYLVEREGDLLKEKLHAYNERKNFEADYCIKSDEGITKAEKMSIVASKEYRNTELTSEVEYQKLRGFRSQVNEFCEALRQKISAARREMEQNKYNDTQR